MIKINFLLIYLNEIDLIVFGSSFCWLMLKKVILFFIDVNLVLMSVEILILCEWLLMNDCLV